jgi:hypothetical protein
MIRPSNFNQLNPNQATALCTRAQAEQLANYDHHRVTVLEREAVLLTYEWLPVEEHVVPLVLTVVFHHADAHPPAPVEIQTLVSTLRFQARGQPR